MVAVIGLIVTGCSDGGHATKPSASAVVLGFHVVATHPHDPASFTEGLAFGDRSHLYESSGHYGASKVSLVDPETGVATTGVGLDARFFGEGLAVVGDTVIQLTWKEGTALRWDAPTLVPSGQNAFQGEGWGLTFDPTSRRLIQSDGSATLRFRRHDTFSETGTVRVTKDAKPIDQLNELEFVDGVVWANVWKSDELLRIDPESGRVTGSVDLSSLDEHLSVTDPDLVLNGIAHRPGDPANRLWVTGKGWSTMTEIEIEAAG